MPMYVVVPVFLGFLFGWLGISGSDRWPLPVAVAVWTLVVFIDWVAAGIATHLIARFSVTARWPFWALLLVGLALSKFVVSPINHAVAEMLDALGYTTDSERTMGSSVLTAIVPQAILWVTANYAVRAYRTFAAQPRSAPPTPAPPAASAPVPDPAFLSRVRLATRGTLVAVRAEQHYIRVYTANGDDLILYKFGDAVRELGAARGRQVHRSWWVARDAVQGFASPGREALRLANGIDVPVGRTYLRDARELLDC